MTEWREIPGYEGFYEISDDGQVRSMDRAVEVVCNGVAATRHLKGRLLRPTTKPNGYLAVGLYVAGRRQTMLYIHRGVLAAFVGQPFENADACHLDGSRTNNTVGNLYWGTRSENVADAVRHGTAHWAKRTHCPNNHKYTPENLWRSVNPATGKPIRRCRTCSLESGRRARALKRVASL